MAPADTPTTGSDQSDPPTAGSDPSDPPDRGTNPVVLVVDVSRKRADPSLETAYSSVVEMMDDLTTLIDTARDAEVPVCYSHGGRSYHLSRGADLAPVERGGWAKHAPLREETPEEAAAAFDLAPQLSPRDDEVVLAKSGPSPFFQTMLPVYLSSLGVDTVIVTGMTTSGCARAAVVDAFSHDNHVLLAPECLADSRPEAHEFHLEEMARKYATVEPLEAVLTYLESV